MVIYYLCNFSIFCYIIIYYLLVAIVSFSLLLSQIYIYMYYIYYIYIIIYILYIYFIYIYIYIYIYIVNQGSSQKTFILFLFFQTELRKENIVHINQGLIFWLSCFYFSLLCLYFIYNCVYGSCSRHFFLNSLFWTMKTIFHGNCEFETNLIVHISTSML